MTTKIREDSALGADDVIGLGLLKNHIHILNGDIDEASIAEAVKWVIFENTDDREKLLTLYINSAGGNLCDAFALIDIMRNSKHPIRTIGMGNVMSAAFMIFVAGTRGERYIAKNTSILCHQFSENTEGKYHDLKASLRENENMNNRMVDLIKECTDLSTRVIKTKLLPPSDVWLTVDEVIELGIADHIF
jgi:ATP-dependent Clp protease protease subunit